MIVVFGIALRLTGVSLHLSQQAAAGLLVLFFLSAVLLSAQNGLILLFLLPPLFNGEDHQPYFVLLELLIYLTVLVGLARLWWRRAVAFPLAAVFGLFLLSTVISFPLNLEELWLEVRISSWPDVLESLRRGDLWSNLFYVRTVLDVASGIGLCLLAANYRWTRERLGRLAVAATVLYAAVGLVGLFWRAVFAPTVFLTVYFDGRAAGAFSGVGFNPSYFAQYALAYLPLVVLVLVERAPAWAKGLAAGAVLMTGYTILATYQRGAWAVLLVELGLLGGALLCLRAPRLRPALWLAGGAMAGILGVAAGLLLLTPAGPRVAERIAVLWHAGDSYRQHVLPVAWRMFREQPVLGIGSGRFAHMFQFYSAEAGQYQWGSLSSHNLYAQLLAEQGAVGLLSFLAVLGAVVVPILRRQSRLGAERPAVLFLLVSLGAWLIYGLFQYTLLMRSMQGYLWITLGLLVALTRPVAIPVRLWRPAAAVAVAVLAIAVALRAHEAATRPLQAGLTLGVHAVEPGQVRWTRREAVFNLRVEGTTLRIPVACPVPEVVERQPQRVTVFVDGVPVRQATLGTPAWTVLEVPVTKPVGSTVLLGIRAGYTFVPAALGLNEDDRRLGVLMAPMTWSARAPAP